MTNLNLAFDIAEQHLDIPKMLDAEGKKSPEFTPPNRPRIELIGSHTLNRPNTMLDCATRICIVIGLFKLCKPMISNPDNNTWVCFWRHRWKNKNFIDGKWKIKNR